jgi:hypothetical protein|tara:strand:- start:78335 stop:78454 length:120 start_codon:yes stop_codon:yes gene_type:complete
MQFPNQHALKAGLFDEFYKNALKLSYSQLLGLFSKQVGG